MGRASRSKRERGRTVTLWHFTSEIHLPLIKASGFLRPTESNVSFTNAHAGPDVVWLLDIPSADEHDHGLVGTVDKRAVRIEVRTKAERWLDWIDRQPNVDIRTKRILIETGGGIEAARHWWVAEHPIPRSEWVGIDIAVDNAR